MPYAVERGSRRFVGSGGVVAVHAALAYLLIFGLAPPPFIAPPETRVTGVPVDPPTEPPKPEERRKEEPKTQTEEPVHNPDPPIHVNSRDPVKADPPIDKPLPPIVGPRPPVVISDPIEANLFTPKLAKPINSVMRWVTTNDYPRISISREEQGVTRFRVEVGTNGRVQNCTITASSGSKMLDDTTCTKVTNRARFEPATDKYGAKVPGTYSNSVNWKLPE